MSWNNHWGLSSRWLMHLLINLPSAPQSLFPMKTVQLGSGIRSARWPGCHGRQVSELASCLLVLLACPSRLSLPNAPMSLRLHSEDCGHLYVWTDMRSTCSRLSGHSPAGCTQRSSKGTELSARGRVHYGVTWLDGHQAWQDPPLTFLWTVCEKINFVKCFLVV